MSVILVKMDFIFLFQHVLDVILNAPYAMEIHICNVLNVQKDLFKQIQSVQRIVLTVNTKMLMMNVLIVMKVAVFVLLGMSVLIVIKVGI